MIRSALRFTVLSGSLLLGSPVLPRLIADEPDVPASLPMNVSETDSSQTPALPDSNEPPRGQVPADSEKDDDDTSSSPMVTPNQPLASDESSPKVITSTEPAPLTSEMILLRERIRDLLAYYHQEPISVAEYSPWGTMHALIAFGVDTKVVAGNRKVNAIGWLCMNQTCRGMKLLYVDKGKLRVRVGPGLQGHEGQFLAMLAQSKVKPDFPIRVDGHDFTVADLIESEKETCRAKTELTFKLIGLTHYLGTDAQWKSDIGEDWDMPRLIKEELAQPVVGSACGGTHRMTGFSYAVNKRAKLGEEFDGQWLRAKKFVESYHEYIFKLQNPDGSFSTNWFAGRGDFGDENRRVQTTGHMLEWLVYSLPKEELDDPRVLHTVNYLTNLLHDGAIRHKKWEIGPRGHAIHALALYNERRFSDKPGSREEVLTRTPVLKKLR